MKKNIIQEHFDKMSDSEKKGLAQMIGGALGMTAGMGVGMSIGNALTPDPNISSTMPSSLDPNISNSGVPVYDSLGQELSGENLKNMISGENIIAHYTDGTTSELRTDNLENLTDTRGTSIGIVNDPDLERILEGGPANLNDMGNKLYGMSDDNVNGILDNLSEEGRVLLAQNPDFVEHQQVTKDVSHYSIKETDTLADRLRNASVDLNSFKN